MKSLYNNSLSLIGAKGEKGEKGDSGGGGGGSSSFSFNLNNTNANKGDILILSNVSGSSELYEPINNSSWIVTGGGSSIDQASSIAVDSSGNSYVTGYFTGTFTIGGTTLTSAGNTDIFVAKINTSGVLQWAIRAGSSDSNSGEQGNSIAVDSSGNCYVAGHFRGTATFGGTTLTATAQDIFISKIDTNGSFDWTVQVVNGSGEECKAIAVDNSGNIYIAGNIAGTVNFGGIVINAGATRIIFVAKMDNNGNFLWVTTTDPVNTGSDNVNDISLDNSGNIYITGVLTVNAIFGSTTLTASGTNDDIYVAKLNNSGVWQWAVSVGGIAIDQGLSIITDQITGDSYVSGYVISFCQIGTTLLKPSSTEIFIAKINTNGVWQWATQSFSAPSQGESSHTICLDNLGYIYISGGFANNCTLGSDTLVSYNSTDGFLAKLNPSDGTFLWAVALGGNTIWDIACDSSNNIYIAGSFDLSAFINNNFVISSAGNNDLYITKFIQPVTRGLIVCANENGTIGNPLSVSWSGVLNNFTGLTPHKYYFYDPPNKTPTLKATPYKLGLAISSTEILFSPLPIYY